MSGGRSHSARKFRLLDGKTGQPPRPGVREFRFARSCRDDRNGNRVSALNQRFLTRAPRRQAVQSIRVVGLSPSAVWRFSLRRTGNGRKPRPACTVSSIVRAARGRRMTGTLVGELKRPCATRKGDPFPGHREPRPCWRGRGDTRAGSAAGGRWRLLRG